MKNIIRLVRRVAVPTALVLLLLPVSLFAQPSFKPAVNYAVGGHPLSVIAADLDRDGDKDLVVANRDNANVSVLKNNGDGTFAPKINYATRTIPFSVFAADFDGDGDLDLAVANEGSDDVSVLMNNGDGTFAPGVEYQTGQGPFSVVAADLDGINGPDLAVANRLDNTVSILKNKGDGTFAPKLDYNTGNKPHRMFASDLDNDGDQDLVTANLGDIPAGNGTTISILVNDGSGAFSTRFDYTTGGSGPAEAFAADLDGDGDKDLAVTNWTSNTVSVLKHNGDSAISDSTFADRDVYATGVGPIPVFAADLDGDGHKDLVVGNFGSLTLSQTTVSVLMNKGDGTFATRADLEGVLGPHSVFVSDLDGDGDLDIVTANWGGNNVSVLKNLTNDRAPTLMSPPNGATSQLQSLAARWNALVGASTYRLQVSSDSLFLTTQFDDSTLTDTSHQLYNLAGKTTYYWRVNWRNFSGTGVWSITWSFTTLSVVRVSMNAGWNLVSVPVTTSDYRKDTLFRTSASSAFAYEGSYELKDTLSNRIGYWLKFGSAQNVPVAGLSIPEDTFDVVEGWNLIGSISFPVATSDVNSNPGGIKTSRFFGYDGSYIVEDTIRPGRGYWVKVNQGGRLILSSSLLSAISSLSRITIIPSADLPPAPPEGANANLESRTPNRFALEQNYPNPFNPLTVIRYQLPVKSHVTLRIYNVLGQEVAVLVDEIQDAGYKSVEWNARGAPSGLYFYRMTADNYTTTKKAILIK